MLRSRTFLLASLALLVGFACDRVTPVAPVGSTITLTINPTRISAQGETAKITAIVRKEDGTRVNPGTQVNFSTTLGEIEPTVAPTDEAGVAVATLTGDGRIGIATVAASTGAAAGVAVDVQIGSAAASITLNATPTDVGKDPPEEGETIRLVALIRDDTGAPLAGVTVNFEADIGTLKNLVDMTDENGQANDQLTVNRNNISVLLEPFFEIRAQVAIEGGSLIEDVVDILVRGAPETLTLQATPSTVAKADGGDIQLLAFVRDNLGDPLKDALVNFQTELGTLDSGGAGLETQEDGTARDVLRLTPTDLASFSPRTFKVSAETAGFAGELRFDEVDIQIDTASPVASFTMSGASASLTVSFTNTSTGQTPLTYEWDFFNDGTVDSVLVTPPAFTASAGVFSVKLTVTNALGSDSVVQSVSLPFP